MTYLTCILVLVRETQVNAPQFNPNLITVLVREMHTPQALVTPCHPHFDINIILESTLLRIIQYSLSESPRSKMYLL